MEHTIVMTFALTAIVFFILGNWSGRRDQKIIDNYRREIKRIDDAL